MNYLNLDTAKTKKTVNELNILLADYHLYYQKLRNFHWNIIGENFFDLHIKFEEMYNDTLIKIDEVAERILTLRFQPVSNLSDYIKMSEIKESPSEIKDSEMIEILLEDHGTLLVQMRKTVETADAGGDEGTIDLLGAYIRELEKTSWMLDTWKMNKTSNHKKS
ncbi:Dps family protein [Leeuwenhoekiella sp. W20_SRS_FM14]|uniref:Dps family protein n=1 Tax=Leeuwenhoekiella sp. W20_SRS_FM14 TaxID=3240270 RepID=UPI003F95C88C